MSEEKIKIRIVIEAIVAVICFVAFFFLNDKDMVRYIMLAVGMLWVVAAAMNYLKLKDMNK